MSGVIEIDGKNFLPIREANRLVSYSRDYITRLAREEKISAVRVGRKWYVDGDSLRQYESDAEFEAQVRKEQLSAARKQEREAREATEQRLGRHDVVHRKSHVRSMVAAMLVLSAGLLAGGVAYTTLSYSTFEQLAGGGFLFQESVAEPQLIAQTSLEAGVSVPTAPVHRQDDSLVATATTTQDAIADQVQAVVLLPQQPATTSDLFSDPVQVRVEPDATYVELVNETGEVVGEPLPFVSVPVAASATVANIPGR